MNLVDDTTQYSAYNTGPQVNQTSDLSTGMMCTINLYTFYLRVKTYVLIFLSHENFITESEQVGNFEPHEDHAMDLPAGIGHHCLIFNSYIVNYYACKQHIEFEIL